MRIVDFSTHLSGPLASHLLAELGADVVKVENPVNGDGNREIFPIVEGVGMFHLALNSGARSIAFDRRSAEWPDLIAACARWADAVIVGARPVDARRRGMDFATMAAANPGLVYCSISGFGDDGPWRDRTAHGQTIDMMAGLVPVDRGGAQPVTRPGWRTAGTTLGGVFAALGVTGALTRRAEGVRHAQYVSVSLWHAALWWSWRDTTMLANTGEPWSDYTDLGSRYGLYETADDRVLLIAPIEQKFWIEFCEVAGLPVETRERGDWSTGSCYGAGAEFDDERQRIAAAVRERPLGEWMTLLGATSVPCAPLMTLTEAMDSEHGAANAVMQSIVVGERTMRVPTSPVKLGGADGTPAAPTPLSPPPRLGEHTDELERELGIV